MPLLVLPSYFPITPKECKEIATPFFSCFSKETEGGNKNALESCASDGSLTAYTNCAEKHISIKQKSTWSAPQSYISQTSGSTQQWQSLFENWTWDERHDRRHTQTHRPQTFSALQINIISFYGSLTDAGNNANHISTPSIRDETSIRHD